MRLIKEQLPAGTVINNQYRIDRVIGVGGMGTVYEATHTKIKHKVALKCLHSTHAADKNELERFMREAQAAGSIRHDNICQVFDLGVTDNHCPYLVMPLLDGCSLGEELKRHHTLPLARIADIAGQTLTALAAVHNAGLIHRDLKPDNIFVTQLGDRKDFVKVLDFGISKLVRDNTSLDTITETGMILGTLSYMAPEQASGEKQIDHRVDIYSMGVILYEALTGQRPIDNGSYIEMLGQILTKNIPRPREIEPSIPVEIEQLIVTAMARKPEDRFSDVPEMRRELARAMATATVPLYPSTEVDLSELDLQRSRMPVKNTPHSQVITDTRFRRSTRRWGTPLRATGFGLVLGIALTLIIHFNQRPVEIANTEQSHLTRTVSKREQADPEKEPQPLTGIESLAEKETSASQKTGDSEGLDRAAVDAGVPQLLQGNDKPILSTDAGPPLQIKKITAPSVKQSRTPARTKSLSRRQSRGANSNGKSALKNERQQGAGKTLKGKFRTEVIADYEED